MRSFKIGDRVKYVGNYSSFRGTSGEVVDITSLDRIKVSWESKGSSTEEPESIVHDLKVGDKALTLVRRVCPDISVGTEVEIVAVHSSGYDVDYRGYFYAFDAHKLVPVREKTLSEKMKEKLNQSKPQVIAFVDIEEGDTVRRVKSSDSSNGVKKTEITEFTLGKREGTALEVKDSFNLYFYTSQNSVWYLLDRPKPPLKVGDVIAYEELEELPFASIVLVESKSADSKTNWATVFQKSFNDSWSSLHGVTITRDRNKPDVTRTIVWLPGRNN